MIKSLIFDLGKVIVPFDFNRGFAAMAPLCSLDPAEMRSRLSATDLVERFECGLVEPEEFVEQFSRLLELSVDYARFCEIWSSVFLPDPLIPESWFQALRGRYRLLLLSNTNAIHFAMIRRTYPAMRHFDSYVLSYQVKAMKPSPRIYQEAIARAGCQAGECFYTDDIPKYVEAAREIGMDAVQFHSAGQLKRELYQRGITWE
ncbi:MAG: HAD family phosphatase [Bryobacterales bacterium]|nr:HAD family phosphatase [Bryobacterales bacterium]